MIRKTVMVATLISLMIMGIAAAAQAQDTLAQENIGSISGIVFRDVNANGLCTEEDEPGVTGIPIQLVNRDDDSIVNLVSGDEGFYELVSATEGTWQATVNPGSGWRVTSQQSRQVLVTEDEPDVEEVDFCIVQVTETSGGAVTGGAGGAGGGSGGSGGSGGGDQPVLPESGAPISPALMLAGGLGLLLLLAGAGLFAHGRRTEN